MLIHLVVSVALAQLVDVSEILSRSKQCHAQRHRPSTVECEYRAGRDLVITIAGVGERFPLISFDKSDRNGDFFAQFSATHQCIVVKTGAEIAGMGLAFISPRTGKVHQNADQCGRE